MAAVDGLDDAAIREILTGVRRIAVVGASPNPLRPSDDVLGVLINRGYETFPINPGHAGALIGGRRVFARLADVPVPIDMVDVFRNSAAAGDAVDDALRSTPAARHLDAARRDQRGGGRAGARQGRERGHEPLPGDRTAPSPCGRPVTRSQLNSIF